MKLEIASSNSNHLRDGTDWPRKTDFEVYSSGHRNIQGMAKVGDKLYAVEQGPMGGDELNLIEKGKNYGYPIYSLGSAYDNRPNKVWGDPEKYTPPVLTFLPSIAPPDVTECPKIIVDRYSPLKCLLVLSLRGRSVFVVLLEPSGRNAISVERIYTGMRARKFIRDEARKRLYMATEYFGMYLLEFSLLPNP